jgi:hypothetical protein
MFGVLAGQVTPASSSYSDRSNWAVSSLQTYRAGTGTSENNLNVFSAGHIVSVIMNCDTQTLTVSNETAGWTKTLTGLPQSATGYFLHVNCYNPNDCVSIEPE